MAGLIERNDRDIVGVLSCYDRVIITGTLPGFGHSEGMTSYMRANGIRIFHYTKFAEPLRDQSRQNAARLARQNGIEIQSLRKGNIRKESVVQGIHEARPARPIAAPFDQCTQKLPKNAPTADVVLAAPMNPIATPRQKVDDQRGRGFRVRRRGSLSRPPTN